MEGYIYTYFFNFSLWLWIEEAFFAAPLPKRRHWPARLAVICPAYLALGYGYIQLVRLIPNAWYPVSILYYLSLFACSLGVLALCCKVEWKEILFVGTAGYALQHITYSLTSVCYNLILRYGDAAVVQSWYYRLCANFLIYLLSGFLCYKTLVRSHQERGALKRVDVRMLLLSLAVLLTSVVLSILVDNWITGEIRLIGVICRLYAVIACTLGLLMQFDISLRNRAEAENELLEQLLHLEKQQQRLSRETIDTINQKCHDLKYQIAALETMDGSQRQATIGALQRAVMIYDGMAQTGNDTLDLVLTEKSLLCQKYNIKLSCMIDGERLSFLSPSDLYSLFGNALDNAIEAVTQVEEEKRVITMRMVAVREMLLLHIDNYCGGQLAFEDGLPVTTKGDRRFHGFGTRSICYIVHRYNGEVRMGQTDNRFDLDILFPLAA